MSIIKLGWLLKDIVKKEGIDFHESFSPVVKFVTIGCVISLALFHDWNLFQLNVNNAFLHGDLIEEVYMSPLEGYPELFGNKVCKFKKSLSRLKQAPGQWNGKLKQVLIEFGFVQSLHDYSLFTFSEGDVFLILLIYVDYIILIGNNEFVIKRVKHVLDEKFKIKDLGVLQFFLSIEVVRINHELCLSQRKYVLDLLHAYGMLGCKTSVVPMEQNLRLVYQESDNAFLDNPVVFQKLIGKLIYLTITRHDICFFYSCSEPVHAQT